METLLLTPFVQSIIYGKEQQDWADLYKDFVKSVFDVCHNTSIGYDKLIFILYYTHIELISLSNEVVSEDAKKKCRKSVNFFRKDNSLIQKISRFVFETKQGKYLQTV